jgi:CRP-like cAMP-binding protein
MPLDWLNTPLDADIGELLARKKRAKAIETLRRQLQGRLAPPVAVRLQLADLLMQAGRIEEAVPVFLGLADEFASDGFVAKAVAILKRVDRVQPGRADIAERLEKLVHQQKRVSSLPALSRPPSSAPEFGMEELDEGGLAPAGYDEAIELPSEAPAPVAAPEPEPMAAEIEVEASLDDHGGPASALEPAVEPTVEQMLEPAVEAMPDEIRASSVDAIVDAAPLETLEPLEDEPDAPSLTPEPAPDAPTDLVSNEALPPEPAADPAAVSIDPASAGEGELVAATDSASEEVAEAGADGAATAGPGVGRRIRRALWRFLASLPGAEEGAATEAAPSDALTPVGADPAPVTDEAPALPPPAEPQASEPAAAEAAVEMPNATAASEGAAEPLVPSLGDIASDDSLLPEMPPAGEDAMSEEAFRQNLLDIVEDVLHRPPPPATDDAVDRARVLDLARRMVASRLFKDLSDEELLEVVRGLRLHTYEAGDIVVTEGEPGQSLFTLTTGRVKVFVANPDLRNFEVATLTEGDFFGEISSLSGRPRTATVVAAGVCELLELDRPTLDSIARTHARVRDVLESSYIERASSPEAAAVRAVPLPDSGTRRKAIEVLESHFGESRWDPRMRLRLADVLLKAGKDEDAIPILVGLADELAREGFADKAVAIIKKIEQVQRRNVQVVNLAPLIRSAAAVPRAVPAARDAAAPPRPRAITDDRFNGWLVDLVRDTVGKPRALGAAATADAPALKGYGPGLLANPLFEDFSEEELLAFIHGLRLLSFEPGDVIITEGEAGQSVFILATGEVKVFVRGPGRQSVMLGALGEGSFFGEISTLSGRPRSATITAAAACEILELDLAALDAISTTHPRVRTVLETFSAARSADPEAARARGERP